MPSSIQQLDSVISKSIQASLFFPSLTSIVLELIYKSLNASPTSFIEVCITLSPEWQVSCQYDSVYNSHSEIVQDSVLDYISYLGVVDVQSGQYKHILKAGSVIFSGSIDPSLGGNAGSSITIRDIYCNLPVRRQALNNPTHARAEVEKCARLLSVVVLPHYLIRVILRYSSIEQAGSKVILDAAKTSSLFARYEDLFCLNVTAPTSALFINSIKRVKHTEVQVEGFIIPFLLSSRSRQHLLLNGRLHDHAGYDTLFINSLDAASIRVLVSQLLESSYIGSDQNKKRNADDSNCAAQGKCFGYFLNISHKHREQFDPMQLEDAVRKILTVVLQAHHMLSPPEIKRVLPRNMALLDVDRSPKKLRSCSGRSINDSLCGQHDNCRQYTLNRAGLLRDPKEAKTLNDQAGWVSEILSNWKNTLPMELPFEQRILRMDGDSQYDFEVNAQYFLQKEGLASSRVIGQVDTKYIALVYGNDALVMVDQHAAHERVRLEAMLSKYMQECLEFHSTVSATISTMNTPVILPLHLAQIFKDDDVIHSLSFWGFSVSLEMGTASRSTLRVRGVPEALSEKLGNEQNLRLFILDLATSLDDEGVRQRMKLSPSSRVRANEKDNGWIFTLRHLPTPILNLFNSMACRGAIMFNDPLTNQQCEKLTLQLSQTIWPFICAHGRPSTAPIASLQLQKGLDMASPIRWEALLDQSV